MRKMTVSRMRERYAQTVLTFRITYVQVFTRRCVCIILFLLYISDFLKSQHQPIKKYTTGDTLNATHLNDAPTDNGMSALQK